MTWLERLVLIGSILCCTTAALKAQGTDVVCLEFPIYEDGNDSLYYGDYYSQTNPCPNDSSPRYKWFQSDTAVPQACPICCDPSFTCVADATDTKSPTPEDDENGEEEDDIKKTTKAGAGAKAAGDAQQKAAKAATFKCKSLANPVDVNFTYKTDAHIGGRKARKKGTADSSTDAWDPKSHIKVVSTNWALVKYTVNNMDKTMPVKVYVLELRLEDANRELNGLSQDVEKFKKTSQLMRIGFEATDLPAFLKNNANFPTVTPAQVDKTCKTTFTINVDGETDSYFITSAHPVFD